MLTILALIMIVTFIAVLAKKKMSVFTALTLKPLLFGIISIFITRKSFSDIWGWIQSGLFYSVNPETGKVSIILTLC